MRDYNTGYLEGFERGYMAGKEDLFISFGADVDNENHCLLKNNEADWRKSMPIKITHRKKRLKKNKWLVIKL